MPTKDKREGLSDPNFEDEEYPFIIFAVSFVRDQFFFFSQEELRQRFLNVKLCHQFYMYMDMDMHMHTAEGRDWSRYSSSECLYSR